MLFEYLDCYYLEWRSGSLKAQYFYILSSWQFVPSWGLSEPLASKPCPGSTEVQNATLLRWGLSSTAVTASWKHVRSFSLKPGGLFQPRLSSMFLFYFLLQITVSLLLLLLLSFVCRCFKATTIYFMELFPTYYLLHANNIKVDSRNLDIFKFLLKITKGKYQEA